MSWSRVISGLAVLGAGVALIVKGEAESGTALAIAGAAELGATAVVKG